MKIFTHFDKTIFMIYLTHDFISLLRKEDMSFRVLPVILKPPLSLNDRVVAYTSLDDIQLYALIVHWEYGEKVLITDTVPEDGWESLYMDVCAQRQGEQPNEPGTLFYAVVQDAIAYMLDYDGTYTIQPKEQINISISVYMPEQLTDSNR